MEGQNPHDGPTCLCLQWAAQGCWPDSGISDWASADEEQPHRSSGGVSVKTGALSTQALLFAPFSAGVVVAVLGSLLPASSLMCGLSAMRVASRCSFNASSRTACLWLHLEHRLHRLYASS